jgi:hypothetical protein
MKLELLQKYPFTLRQDTILKRYQLAKQYKILLPTREDWCTQGKIALGAGAYGPRDIHRESSLSTAFQAEVMAILWCTQLLLSKNIDRNGIHICSDSRAAMTALAHYRIGFGMGEFASAIKTTWLQ